MYKKSLAFLLAILCILSTAVVSVSAAGNNGTLIVEGDYKVVYYDDGRAKLFEASVSEEHVVVPKTVGGHTITSISGAFKNNTNIKSVIIPDTVTDISGGCFENCENLESIIIPDSVTKIGSSAFKGCSSLEAIDIPDSVTLIDDEAFLFCHSLKEITIPESVIEIGNNAFAYCENLSTININKNPDLIISGSAFNESKWYNSQPDGVVYLDRFALNYKGRMPENLKVDFKEGTTAICSNMFACSASNENNTSLVSISLPDTLTFIGEKAFYKCVNLETVDLPDSITHIGSNAFSYCSTIDSAIIPAGVKDMRDAFAYSGVKSVTLMGNPDMWYHAFSDCENLNVINLPDTIENINKCAFEGCRNLESVILPDSVKIIEWGAFMNCEKLKDIRHSGKIYMISNESFKGSAWENSQPDGFVYFGDVLMGYKGNSSSLKELSVKKGTKAIASSAFARYNNLTKVTFPEGLVVIGNSSFRSTLVEEIDIPESVEFIGHSAFSECRNLSKVIIRGSGTIEQAAFINCLNIKSITVSANVAEIQDTAFGAYYGMANDPIYIEDFTVYGFTGSEAEKYANKNNLIFVGISELLVGDVNRDGDINIKDATAIQKHLAAIDIFLKEAEFLADYDADGKITIKDATAIQKFLAGITE